MKKILVLAVAVLALAVPFVAHAQDTTSVPNPIVITEQRVNESFFVTNPPSRHWDNLSVDFQSNQVYMTGDLTFRGRRGQPATTYAVTATITASVTNGRIYWSLLSATADGQPASDEVVTAINQSVVNSFRNFVRSHMRAGRVTSIAITDADIQIYWE